MLVTGHTGFKGGWLSMLLLELGADVYGYSLAPKEARCFYNVCSLDKYLSSDFYDVRDLVKFKSVMSSFRPDIVFHLAAQALVRDSYRNPVETFETNVMGTVNLFEAVRQSNSVRAVINVTTDKVYENKEWIWGYRESDRLGGFDPYSSSKACSELVTQAFVKSFIFHDPSSKFNCGVATARAGNVIGGGDWSKDRLIPDVLQAVAEGRPVKIRNPNSVRPWQHVLDPLSGYVLLAENLYESPELFNGAWNFGPDQTSVKTVGWVAERIHSIIGGKLELDDMNQPHEARLLNLDCSKARNRLGWQPKLELSTAIASLVEWHQQFNSGENMLQLTLDEIRSYFMQSHKNESE